MSVTRVLALTQVADFRCWVREQYGIELSDDGLIADGRWHCHHVGGDRGKEKKFAYVVDDWRGQLRIGFIDFKRGARGCWRGERAHWLGKAEWQEQQRQLAADRRARERQILERQASTAVLAAAVWREAKPARGYGHPYLLRKCVRAHGLRVHRGPWTNGRPERLHVSGPVLLVPMRDRGGTLWNLQAIFPEKSEALGRDKDFLAGGRKTGLWHWLGRERSTTICIAEGYATAATIYADTQYKTAVAFDCGNLEPVAMEIRRRHRDHDIVVCADNDAATPGNPGVSKARQAAAAVGGMVAIPPIAGDFNDWVLQTQREGGRGQG